MEECDELKFKMDEMEAEAGVSKLISFFFDFVSLIGCIKFPGSLPTDLLSYSNV